MLLIILANFEILRMFLNMDFFEAKSSFTKKILNDEKLICKFF